MLSSISKNKTLVVGAGAVALGCLYNYYFLNKIRDHIVIVGGGTAGIGVAAMLRNKGAKNLSIVDPSHIHYYQPLWTLVGGGQKLEKDSMKAMEHVIPYGTKWLKHSVVSLDPDQNQITLDDGSIVHYDYLIVAAGMQIDWDSIPGLSEGLKREDSGIVSNYDPKGAEKTWLTFKSLAGQIKQGKQERASLLFTHTPTAVKCAGASQKIMWMLEDTLRGLGLRDRCDISFITPNDAMFSVPHYANKLETMRVQKGVVAYFKHVLKSLDVDRKIATMEEYSENNAHRTIHLPYDMIHVTPHLSAPDFIKRSPLATIDGWLDVDKYTLQSVRYPNVFGLGDCTNTPNSKTAAAAMAQAPVVVHNIRKMIEKRSLDGFYDGYGACPLIISRDKVILAEFKYEKELAETFHKDTGPFPLRYIGTEGDVHERFFFYLKKHIFPFIYWNLWTHGLWFGPSAMSVKPIPQSTSDGIKR